MELDIVLFACSQCGKVGWDSSNMKRHVQSVSCSRGTLTQFQGRVTYQLPQAPPSSHTQVVTEDNVYIPPTERSSPAGGQDDAGPSNDGTGVLPMHVDISNLPLVPRKRGPKAYSIQDALSGRIAARDNGDEVRIDYIFSTPGMLEEMIASTLDELPSFMFKWLYSRIAPYTFRSIVYLRNTVLNQRMIYEVKQAGDEHGETEYVCASLNRYYARDVATYLLDLAESIFKVSVPLRRVSLHEQARAFGDIISDAKENPTIRMVSALYTTIGAHVSQKYDAPPPLY